MLRIYFTRNLLLLTSLALVSRGEEDHILPDGIFANDLKAVPAVSEACGSGNSNGDWYYDDVTQNCFFYSSIIATWPEAERQCVLMDSHLATIEQRNHEFVRLIVQGGKPGWTPAWIGLRLSHLPTMTHTWVDGNLTNLYRPWGDNEPSPQGLEGCVVINSDTGKFSDYRCLANPGMRFVCRKTKAGEIPPITTSAPLEVQDHWGCPIDDRPGLLRFGSFCYWFSGLGEVKNWNDALKTCQDLYHHPNDPSKSSSLVSIHSDLENDFLVSHMGDRVPRWTGMREESDGTTAYWADGSFVNYLNWHFGEPRPSGAQCVSMYAEPARTGMWDDTDCGSSFGYICKMQKDASKPAPESPGNPCPENFRQYKNGVCFGIVPVSAFATCAHVGPNIRPASILSRSENAFIRVLAHESNKFAPTNATAWLGGKELRGSVKWDSGCYATFNNIAHFYDAPYPVDNCIIMHYNGVWRTVNCELEQLNVPYVVCERREGEGECDKTEPSDVQGVCPMGFPKDCGDFCYRLGGHLTSSQSQIDAQATWEEAKTACANMGSSLVTIRNEKDQRCVEKLLTESDWHLWIGLYYQDNLVTPPTPPSGRWKWLDPLYEFQQTFVNWQAGEPNYMDPNSQYRELCAEMLHGLEKPEDDGKWNNRHCSNGRKQGYICEKVKSPLNNATCGFSDTGDWFYDSKTDNCFFVSRTLASWPNAERTCNSMDSHLATIEQDNHEFVKQILALDYPAGTNFWIGLRLQHIQTMTHTWVDGNVANVFRAWDNNEPNSEGAEACVVMNNLNGKWHDYRCQWANGYRFVCRKPKTPVVPVIPPVIQDHWGCPTACTNCIRYGSSCYWFSPANDLKNWNDAHRSCQELYAHPTDLSKSSDLVSIHNELEQDFLMAHMGADRLNRWTGLHEEIDRSTLYWTDQSYFGYANWNYREPIYMSTQECVLMYGDPAKAGRWNDEICGNTAGYICKMLKDETAPAPVPSNKCLAGFHHLNGVCFGVVPVGSNSNTACSDHNGAQFATILSPYENAFLRVLLNNAANENSIGGGVPAQAWLGGVETGGIMSWFNDCFPKVNNIVNFYTNNQEDNCIALNRDGKWSTHKCTDSVQFAACEKRDVPCEKSAPTNSGVCPVGFPDKGIDFCYRIVHTAATASAECAKVTWSEAKDICARAGGNVLTIRTAEDQKIIEQYLERSTSALWLGLYEEVDPLTNRGTWKWLDDTVSYQGSYQNWEEGEPNVLTGGYTRESCVEIKTNGKWNNVQCVHGATRGYICEKLKIPSTGPTGGPAPTVIPGRPTSASEGPIIGTTVAGGVGSESAGSPNSGGLGGGAIAGIVLSVLLLLPAIAYATYWIVKKRNGGVFPRMSVSYSRDRSSDKAAVIDENNDSFT